MTISTSFVVIVGGTLIISIFLVIRNIILYHQTWGRRKLTIKDCKCKFVRKFFLGEFYFKKCEFHKECIGIPCALALNICDNPKHLENK